MSPSVRPLLSILLVSAIFSLGGCTTDVGISKSRIDADGDGYSEEVDCDDAHFYNNPDADEVCDGVDNDCDGTIDQGATNALTFYDDLDGDGYGDPDSATLACSPNENQVEDDQDCDDTEDKAHPGLNEVCDEIDNDCDGTTDDGAEDLSTFYEDSDEDGYGDILVTLEACTAPEGYVDNSTDCDDSDSAIHPDAPETDCTDPVDYNCDGSTGYADLDGDSSPACEDCDDEDPGRSPLLTELCDEDNVDEDCSGLADDEDAGTDPDSMSTWYRDADLDGWAAGTGTSITQCEQPTGYSALTGDCDDTDRARNPGATEVCDNFDTDEDCDSLTDDDDPSVSASTWLTWYRDFDSDTYGDVSRPVSLCDAPAGYVGNSTDCDDLDAAINPGASEICDAADTDEDCDGLADDADASATGGSTWYRDSDSDLYGSSSTTSACDLPTGYRAVGGDCNDANSAINPGATEICDPANVDEDCDGLADDADPSVTGGTTHYLDGDSDGYGSSSTATRCDASSTYVATGGDCDDTLSSVHPGAAEDCRTGADDDCSGDPNGRDAIDCTDFYMDTDSDGYGAGTAQCWCSATTTYDATTNDDCDDTQAATHPDGTETCGDGVDQDCSGDDLACPSAYTPSGDISLDHITTRLEGGTASLYLGGKSTEILDLNGDGWDDMLAPATGSSGGTVFLFRGPLEGAETAYEADATAAIQGAVTSDYAYIVSRIGDQDGDGDQDFAVGASGWDHAASGAGGVFVFPGDISGIISISTSYPAFHGEGDSYGLGNAISAAGDTNDDGYDDMLVGSSAYGATTTGKVYLLEGPFAVGSRSAATYAATTWVGEGATNHAGNIVIGDVDLDQDGYLDVVISAFGYNAFAGRVYVYYGPFPSGSITLGTSTADAVITGAAAGDYLGAQRSVAVIPDMNGDGYDELAMGAYNNDDTASNAGKVYVFYGPPSGSLSLSEADITVSGMATSDYCGVAVSGVEDIDGDGGGELLVGCFGYDYAEASSCGVGLLYYSGAEGDLDVLDADALFYGSSGSDYAGIAVGPAGDFDQDGVPDFYVNAMNDEYEISTTTNTGIVYLIPGDLDNLLVNAADAMTTSSAGNGFRVARAGDFNHDGYDDVWTSSVSASGSAQLFLGPWSTTATPIATITGDASGDYMGFGLDGGGHINSDVYDDSVIGAPNGDSGGSNAGEVYVIVGRSTPISYTAGTSSYANYYGATASEALGYAVSLVEDWDGDGLDDVLMGANGYNASAGRAFLVTAPSSGTAGAVTTYADSSFTASSTGVTFGSSLDGDGDIDGDGYGDVIIGAPGWDIPVTNAGAAFIYYGGTNAAFTTATADAELLGEAVADAAGSLVAILGDTNADGYDDLLVSAPGTDIVGSSSGTVYLVLGPVTRDLDLADADARLDGSMSGESLGHSMMGSLDGAGDVNADGYDDWLAGSNYSDIGFGDGGTVYLVLGPETGILSPMQWHGPLVGANAGQGAGAGDTNNDGIDDYVIGGYGRTNAWLFLGE